MNHVRIPKESSVALSRVCFPGHWWVNITDFHSTLSKGALGGSKFLKIRSNNIESSNSKAFFWVRVINFTTNNC